MNESKARRTTKNEQKNKDKIHIKNDRVSQTFHLASCRSSPPQQQ